MRCAVQCYDVLTECHMLSEGDGCNAMQHLHLLHA